MKTTAKKALLLLALSISTLSPTALAEASTFHADGSRTVYGSSELFNCLFTLWYLNRGEELNRQALVILGKSADELRARAKELILENKNQCVQDVTHECGYEFHAIEQAIEAGEVELMMLMLAKCPDLLNIKIRAHGFNCLDKDRISPRTEEALRLFEYLQQSGLLNTTPKAKPDYSACTRSDDEFWADRLETHYGRIGKNVALVRIIALKVFYPADGAPMDKKKSRGYVLLEAEVQRPYTGEYTKGHRFHIKLAITSILGEDELETEGMNTFIVPSYAIGSEHVLNITPTVDPDYLPDEGEIVPLDFGTEWHLAFGKAGLQKEATEYVLADIYKNQPELKPAHGDALLAEIAQEKLNPPAQPTSAPLAEPAAGRDEYLTGLQAVDMMAADRYRFMQQLFETMPHHMNVYVHSYSYLAGQGDKPDYYLLRASARGKDVNIILPIRKTLVDPRYMSTSRVYLDVASYGNTVDLKTRACIFFNDEQVSITPAEGKNGKPTYTIDTREGAIYTQGPAYDAAYRQVEQDRELNLPAPKGSVPSMTEREDRAYSIGDPLVKHRIEQMAQAYRQSDHAIEVNITDCQIIPPAVDKDDQASPCIIYKGKQGEQVVHIIAPLAVESLPSGITQLSFYTDKQYKYPSRIGKAVLFFKKGQFELVPMPKSKSKKIVVIDLRKGAQMGMGEEYTECFDYLLDYHERFKIELNTDKMTAPKY